MGRMLHCLKQGNAIANKFLK